MELHEFISRRASKLSVTAAAALNGLDLTEHPHVLRGMVRSEGAGKGLYLDSDGAPPPQVDKGKMSATFVITTPRKDRMGDIVVPRGCMKTIANYRANPRVFFSHRSMEFPIGSARDGKDGPLALEVFDDRVISTCYFNGLTAESDITFAMVARGEIEAASIGFLPILAAVLKDPERPEDETSEYSEDLIHFGDNKYKFFPSLKFYEWDLTEWSIVPTPANPACEALSAHLSRGHVEGIKIPAAFRKALEPYAAPLKVWSPGALLSSEVENTTKLMDGEDLIKPPTQPKDCNPTDTGPDPCKGWPLGAKLIHCSIGKVREWESTIKEMEPELDNPKVQKYAAKKLNKLAGEAYKLQDFGHKMYPDRFEAPDEKSKPAILTKAEDTPAETHLTSLPVPPPQLYQEPTAEEYRAILEELNKMSQRQTTLSDAFYALTGKEP